MTIPSASEPSIEILRSVIETAFDAFIAVDVDGLIRHWNAQAAKTFGWSREEVVGKSMAELIIPPQHRHAHHHGMQHYLKSGEGPILNQRIAITALNRQGQEFPVEITIWPVGSGPDLMFCAFLHDITERKRVEAEAAARTEDLARSNAELDQFATIASHDLQSPLRGIVGFVQLLQRKYKNQLDENAEEYIQLVLDSAQQMQLLITGLLEFSRIGRHGGQLVPTDCAQIMRQVSARLGPLIQQRAASITHDELPVVTGVPIEIQQLLQNLISNAIKFQTGQQPRVHIVVQRDGSYWQFGVRDYGIGIAREHHEKIFRIFQRLHTTDAYEGTGIGLSICQKIVHHHGGRIWVESEPGQGATFYFTLKAHESELT